MGNKLITSGVSIVLANPKYPRNVGAAVRAASCFGAQRVLFTGHRVPLEPTESYRLPREERMRGYAEVEIANVRNPLDMFARNVIPVAVEFRPNSTPLPLFEHPEHAVYVFGPEDGSLDRSILTLCHHFIVIPTRHCVNLAAAVNLILYDRVAKQGVIDVGLHPDRHLIACEEEG